MGTTTCVSLAVSPASKHGLQKDFFGVARRTRANLLQLYVDGTRRASQACCTARGRLLCRRTLKGNRVLSEFFFTSGTFGLSGCTQATTSIGTYMLPHWVASVLVRKVVYSDMRSPPRGEN